MTTPPGDEWTYLAAVDALDHGAVLALVRAAPNGIESYSAASGWQPLEHLGRAVDAGHPWVPVLLSDGQVRSVLDQIGPPVTTTGDTIQNAIDALSTAFRAARGHEGSRSITFGALYVQWIDKGPQVVVELTANKYLPTEQRLAFAGELRVFEAGLLPPGLVGPNWEYSITDEDQFDTAADAVVRALGVFGINAEAILAALAHAEA